MTTNMELAKPLKLKCGLSIPNRLVKAAMAEGMSDKDGLPTEQLNDVYRVWADGGWGMILTGNVQVDARYLGNPRDVYIDTILPEATTFAAFKKYAQATKKHNRSGSISSTISTASSSRTLAPLTNTNSSPSPRPAAVIVQINHPGRQSPLGSGRRSPLAKSLAPSAIPMDMGSGCIARHVTALVFGTPRALTVPEIEDVVRRFAHAARVCAEAGFNGVEIHAAHGYLLAQFLSPRSNTRWDEYGGGTAEGRAKIVVDIVRAIRRETAGFKGFAVGIKFNSVDHQSAGELQDCIRQLRLIVDAGVDFMEVSGGTFEDPTMSTGPGGGGRRGTLDLDSPSRVEVAEQKSIRTKAREAFFLDFAAAIRSHFRDVPLMVTGGLRTRAAMEAAISSGNCDMVGIGRPAVLNPSLPLNSIFNPEVKDQEATLYAKSIPVPAIIRWLGIRSVGAGIETNWYTMEMKNMIKT